MIDDDTRWTAWTRQSAASDPGRLAGLIDDLPAEVPALRELATGMVFHYRGGGDWAANGIAPGRIGEIDTRYADVMLEHLVALRPSLRAPRAPAERLVGCCRDFTLLFVTMARRHGIPARARVGFAGYLLPGWFVDHVVAEVWDPGEQRWRLVEAQVGSDHVDPTDDAPIDVLDLDRRRFRTGADAWRACRDGHADPERFVVDPELDLVATRGWPQLAQGLLLDLASLGGQEMLQWEYWTRLQGPKPLADDDRVLLDELAALLSQPDPDPAEVGRRLDRDELRVPPVVQSFSPAAAVTPLAVTLRGDPR